jgi:hypothetical protein
VKTGSAARGSNFDMRHRSRFLQYVAELIDELGVLAVTNSRRAILATRIRWVEAEIARRCLPEL